MSLLMAQRWDFTLPSRSCSNVHDDVPKKITKLLVNSSLGVVSQSFLGIPFVNGVHE